MDTLGADRAGGAVQPCPLGLLHVELVGPDGQALGIGAKCVVSGPHDHDAQVSRSQPRWTSPKTMPGEYRVEARYEGDLARRFQPPDPVVVTLPESGEATARLAARPFASAGVRLVRRDSGKPVAGLVVTIDRGSERQEGTADADGRVGFSRLTTAGPSYRVGLGDTPEARSYAAPVPIDLALEPGKRAEVTLELDPLAELSVVVVASGGGSRVEIPVQAVLMPASGDAVEAETDPASGKAVFRGLAAGTYRLSAKPSQTKHASYSVASDALIELGAGEARTLELSVQRGESWIRHETSEPQTGIKDSLPFCLVAAPYSAAKARLQALDPGEPIVIPIPEVLPFQDIKLEPGQPCWSDARQSIAIPGWIEAFGARREILFLHTYRPNRVALAVKFRNWTVGDHFPAVDGGELTRYLSLHHVYLILAMDNFEIDSDDLPDEVAGFFGRGGFHYARAETGDPNIDYGEEEIEVKKGVNLYGSVDVKAFPALDAVFEWLGVPSRYVNLQGYLSPSMDVALGGGKKFQVEKEKDFALSATVPAPIPAWGRSPGGDLPALVTAREITVEVGLKHRDAGRLPTVAKLVNRAAGVVHQSAPMTVESSNTVRIRVQDEVLMPFPTFALKAGNVKLISQDSAEIKCSAAIQVEGGFAEWRNRGDLDLILEYTLGGTYSSLGDEEFRLAFLNDTIAVHDLKLVLNATKQTATVSGEFDLGRYDRVGSLEVAMDLKPTPGGRDRADTNAAPRPRDELARDREYQALMAEVDEIRRAMAPHDAEYERLTGEAIRARQGESAADDPAARARLAAEAEQAEKAARAAAAQSQELGEKAKAKLDQAQEALDRTTEPQPYKSLSPEETRAVEDADRARQQELAATRKKHFWSGWTVTARVKPTAVVALKGLLEDAVAKWRD